MTGSIITAATVIRIYDFSSRLEPRRQISTSTYNMGAYLFTSGLIFADISPYYLLFPRSSLLAVISSTRGSSKPRLYVPKVKVKAKAKAKVYKEESMTWSQSGDAMAGPARWATRRRGEEPPTTPGTTTSSRRVKLKSQQGRRFDEVKSEPPHVAQCLHEFQNPFHSNISL